jgi:nucleotide-binding universal stress UspA family protein
MYTVVMGAGTDNDRTLQKARAIADLPAPPESLAVVVVQAGGSSADASEVISFFDERDIATSVERVNADPPTALVEVATDRGADLICVGGRQRSPAGKMQLRDGAQSVMVNTDRPVLVAGEPADSR